MAPVVPRGAGEFTAPSQPLSDWGVRPYDLSLAERKVSLAGSVAMGRPAPVCGSVSRTIQQGMFVGGFHG